MTVETQVTKVTANGDGAATVFSFSPLVIFASSQIQVTKVATDGTETLLAEGATSTTYSVSVSSFPGTGSITYPASGGTPLAAGESLVMKRVLVLEQTIDLENQGGYFPDVQENGFDKLAMIALQQQEEIDRSLKAAISVSSGFDFTIPPLEANQYIRVNSTNTGFEAATLSSTGTAVAATTVTTLTLGAAASVGTSTDYARADHSHDLSLGSEIIPIANGGTGGSTAAAARTQLDVPQRTGANTFTADQAIQDTDSGAAAGPTLILNRASATPAANDEMGEVLFRGRDDGAASVDYAAIRAVLVDPTNASEDAYLKFVTTIAGVLADRFKLGHGFYANGLADPGDGEVALKGLNLDDNRALVGEILDETTISSNTANYAVTWDNSKDYKMIEIIGSRILLDSADTFVARTSTDGGSSYDSTSGDYAWFIHGSVNNVETYHDTNSDTDIHLINNNIGVTSGWTGSLNVKIWHPGDTSSQTAVESKTAFQNTGGSTNMMQGLGQRRTEADVDGIQLRLSGGNNFATALFTTIGWR